MEKEGKEQLLIDLKIEIENLKRQIEHRKVYDLRNNIIRKILINNCRLRYLIPYIITASIIATGCKQYNGVLPFHRDMIEEYLHTKKTIDNYGNVSVEKRYGKYNNMLNIINYYTKWQVENEIYSRCVLSYSLGNLSLEQINEIIDKEMVDVEDILGFPISGSIETKDNLTKEEIDSDEYIEAIIYSVEKNDYIIVKESVKDNVTTSLLYLLTTLLASYIPYTYREKISKFSYFERVSEIEEEYKNIDIENLSKKLEIKEKNYNRLVR